MSIVTKYQEPHSETIPTIAESNDGREDNKEFVHCVLQPVRAVGMSGFH